MADILIFFDGSTYAWDGDLTVREDAVVAAATGLHFGKWIRVLEDPENDKYILALQALLWILKKRAGEPCDIKNLDFSIGAFAKAVGDAMVAAAELAEPQSTESPKENPIPDSSRTPEISESGI